MNSVNSVISVSNEKERGREAISAEKEICDYIGREANLVLSFDVNPAMRAQSVNCKSDHSA